MGIASNFEGTLTNAPIKVLVVLFHSNLSWSFHGRGNLNLILIIALSQVGRVMSVFACCVLIFLAAQGEVWRHVFLSERLYLWHWVHDGHLQKPFIRFFCLEQDIPPPFFFSRGNAVEDDDSFSTKNRRIILGTKVVFLSKDWADLVGKDEINWSQLKCLPEGLEPSLYIRKMLLEAELLYLEVICSDGMTFCASVCVSLWQYPILIL